MEWTKERADYIGKEYGEDSTRATVDRLAEELDVPVRSVIGKLVSMGVYKTPRKLNKAGLPVELKRDLVKEIGDMWGLEIPSLEKSEREDLRMLRDAMKDVLNVRALLVDLEND